MNQYYLCQGFTLFSLGSMLLLIWTSLSWTQFLLIAIAFLASWSLSVMMIPNMMVLMLKINKFGYDINKKGSKSGQKKIPECIGFASAIAFIVVSLTFCVILGRVATSELVFKHTCCTLTILATILLGFADDMLDLQWRYKLIFPFFIVMPAVLSYTGSTAIWIPFPFSSILGTTLDLGIIYFVYLAMLCIYCTNAINIYAGINGLEVGQSIIAAACQLILYGLRASMNSGTFANYSYSTFVMTCFLGSAIALMQKNAYPSIAFVGDTFCYFAGISLAISAMMSETSIIFHFFFIPQLINFMYSLPQLLGFVPCPRHRLTVYDVDKDLLNPIKTNMNMLNLSLQIIGPTNEGKLCTKLLLFQIACSSIPLLLTALGVC